MTTAKEILHTLQLKELYLLHHDHSDKPEVLDSMLSTRLYEIATNGSVVSRDEVFDWLLEKDTKARWEMSNFRGRTFGTSAAHLIYQARQVEGKLMSSSSEGSWRTSLWTRHRDSGEWQLCFHQATKIDNRK